MSGGPSYDQAPKITRAQAKKKFQEISTRSPAQANQAFRVFRSLWNYAVAEYRDPEDQPIFGENPVNVLTDQKLWNTVKPRDTKNGRSITLPLSDTVAEVLMTRPRINQFVFASKSKTGHITEVRPPIKKISSAIGIKRAAHDLRRTFIAIALHNGIELWKVKLFLNHQESGVTVKHYIETSDLRYFKPEVDQISSWINEQAMIAANENVIPIHDRKQA